MTVVAFPVLSDTDVQFVALEKQREAISAQRRMIEERRTMILSSGQVEQLLHGNKDWEAWVKPLQELLPRYQINTPQRVAMFTAQCGHESLNFRVLEENLNYSADGLNSVFSKYFKRAGRDAGAYHRQPERIANVVYADRMGNSNAASGDGWKYRGRGVIQLTGAHNYAMFAESVEKTIPATVKYLGTKEGALESACWFWTKNQINTEADSGDVRAATKRINGGYNGLSDREHHYKEAMKILGGDYTPTSRPVMLRLGSTGDEVKTVQEALGLDADGHFGKVTQSAVVVWQTNNDLHPDGIVGPKTYRAIAELSA